MVRAVFLRMGRLKPISQGLPAILFVLENITIDNKRENNNNNGDFIKPGDSEKIKQHCELKFSRLKLS